MTLTELLSFANYGLVLLYGVFLSVWFSGGFHSKRDWAVLFILYGFVLLLQAICWEVLGLEETRKLYPFLSHLPLWLTLTWAMKRPAGISLVSVLTAYFCCQLPRWVGALFLAIFRKELAFELGYMVFLILFYFLLRKYFAAAAYSAMSYSKQSLWLFGGLPLGYYLFDYAATVYTNALYQGIRMVNEFLPAAMALFYLGFITLYHYQVQKRSQAELQNSVLAMQLSAAGKQAEELLKTREQTAVYRHDMRHHLSAINSYLSAGEVKQAQDYISKVQADVEAITPVHYCENELVSLLCSSFAEKARRTGISFSIKAGVPKELPFSDTELCSLLSNGLENAFHASEKLPEGRRWVDFSCTLRRQNLLIEIQNAYVGEVDLQDEIPVSHRSGHGYGCRSISALVRQHGGLCKFQAEDGIFCLQAAMPMNG